MSRVKRERRFALLALVFLTWAILATVWAVRLRTQVESEARRWTPRRPWTRPPVPTLSPRPRKPRVSPGPPKTTPPPRSLMPWLDNDRQYLRDSQWFQTHAYVDCPTDASGFWPESILDCIIPDQLDGPSASDQAIVADRPNLYYKHLTPSDVLNLLDDLLNLLLPDKAEASRSDSYQEKVQAQLEAAVKSDPLAFTDISLASLVVGLESGNEGKMVRSLSLMVHPDLERILTDITGTKERAKTIYQPFIEGAIGQKVPEGAVHELYLAALNRCGASNDDQSGLGEKREFGDYIAVVQWWSTGDGTLDCNIHVVKP